MGLRIIFDFDPDEPLTARVTCGEANAEVQCWDYQDGLNDLLRAIDFLLDVRHPSHAVGVWQLSGETWWVLNRYGGQLHFALLALDESQFEFANRSYVTYYRPDHVLLEVEIPFHEFVKAVVDALHAAGEERAREYQRVAGSRSPHDGLSRLESYLMKR
ncbi:MAG TPA: hypothetical protein VKT78_15300 [Fimbriimonadaceae bacterium]|nr:hypothetical protein [Fimbriimonadaceae bacterium]